MIYKDGSLGLFDKLTGTIDKRLDDFSEISQKEALGRMVMEIAIHDGGFLQEGIEKLPGNTTWLLDAVGQIMEHAIMMQKIGLLDEYQKQLLETGMER